MNAVTPVHAFEGEGPAGDRAGPAAEALLEQGGVLSFASLPFALLATERRLLDPRLADGKAKNISMRWPRGELRGACGSADELADLAQMMRRYASFSEALASRLFPHYRGALQRGNTTFRPTQIAGRTARWRQDDTRLHVDAFPSNPMQGTRLLRVFCNVHPQGEVRQWRVGEPFEALARRFLPSVVRPLPGASWMLRQLRITKRRRTEYDHMMLQLHDRAKADAAFQLSSPQVPLAFAPGTTWIVYSDQVAHAAMSGQHALEQTFYLEVEQMVHPETSPLRVLERLLGRPLR